MTKLFKAVLLTTALLAGGRLAAIPPVPASEALQPPTTQRLTALMAAAQREGWPAQTAPLRAAAQAAYAQDKLAAADAWFNVYRWSALFGVDEVDYLPHWTKAVTAAGMIAPKNLPVRHLPIGARLLPELQLWILGNTAFSEEFFSLITQVDYLPNVLQILSELHFRDPDLFKSYPSLALAIAIVYDVPPPPYWPHGQVTAASLPRKLPRPVDAFLWWTKQDQHGLTYHRLNQLGADELKFVVDAAAPFDELEWSQQVANYPLKSFARAYTMVRYDFGRVQRNELVWDGTPYTLDGILGAGGICAEQAYFATQVGKARGVPTLLFRGEGIDSRHAWFGFLDAKQKWQLDAGRYAEQRFVTGYAIDPQTWRNISDHELRFLSERFRTLPTFQRSRVHTEFAADFLAAGDTAGAITAARKAIAQEGRNQTPWEILIVAEQKPGPNPERMEATLRQAAEAFRNVPEIQGYYIGREVESLRARGETAAADAEQNRVAQKNQNKRADLNIQDARRTILKTFATQPLEEQIRVYNAVVAARGRGEGIVFFDQVVVPFVEHLWQMRKKAEATAAMETARQALKLDANSQLTRDFAALLKQINDPQ